MSRTASKSVIYIFTGGILNRISCILIDVYLAVTFGTSSYIAYFMIAFRVFQMAKKMLSENGLQMMVLVPYLQALKRSSRCNAAIFFLRFAGNAIIYQIIFITLIDIILFGALRNYSLIPEDYVETAKCVGIIILSIPVISLYTMCSAVLQSDNNFGITSFAPLVFNCTWLFSIQLSRIYYGYVTHIVMSYMLLVAVIVQCAFIIYPAIRTLFEWGLFKESGKSRKTHVGFGKGMLIGIIGLGTVQINSMIDTIFCKIADDSGPAYMWYATRLIMPLASILGVTFASSFIPTLSKKYNMNKVSESDRIVEKLYMKSMFITIPLAGLCFVSIVSFISVLFLHGQFDSSDLRETSKICLALIVSIPSFVGIRSLYAKYYAQRKIYITTGASCIAVLVNFILNYIFVMHLRMGTVSIAVATTASYLFQHALIYLKFASDSVHKQNIKHHDKLIMILCIVFFSVASTIVIGNKFIADGTLNVLVGSSFKVGTESIYIRILRASLMSGLYCAVLYIIMKLLRFSDVMRDIFMSFITSDGKKIASKSAKQIFRNNSIKYD